MPPVSAISGTMGPVFSASARLMARPTSVEPVKATPATLALATSNSPTAPSPGTRCSALAGYAGLVHDLYRKRSDQRRLFGRLGDDGIAGHERGAHLAEKDSERKIPWANADEHAAAAIAQLVALAGRPGHRLRRERNARLRAVIAAVVDRFAQLRQCIVERFAALALQQRDERAAIHFE